jgi:hypothetical protein
MAFQSKGTGAINLAPGSLGVNISNGGTVTAITRTNSSGTYTSVPTVAISAPTTAGGVQATANAINMIQSGSSPTINSGGTGYTVGDVLTIVGGTPTGSAATMTVTSVSGGVITGINYTNFATYSVLPTNPFSVTGGTGSGATFTSVWYPLAFTITNAGSGYVEQPTVTFSGGGGSGAAAYATVGAGTIIDSLGSTMSFTMPAGESLRLRDAGGTATDFVFAVGSPFGRPVIGAQTVSGGGNASLGITSWSTGSLQLYTNNTATEQARIAHTASAVNFVQVTGAATGGRPTVSAQGSDTNVGLTFIGKGNARAAAFFNNSASTSWQLSVGVAGATNAVNFLDVSGSAAGAAPVLSAQGSDTNIPLVLQPKGTGALQAQQTDSTATGGNARGANAVDWQTARNNQVQVASGQYAFLGSGFANTASGPTAVVVSGTGCNSTGFGSFVGSGNSVTASGLAASAVGGQTNTASGYFGFVGGGELNSTTSNSAVTTQSATMNGTTAVTLSGSNASIRVGQIVVGTSIASYTYVAAISGTSLTLSRVASGSSTSTLSFFTPHGVVVGGGNNQATGSYSFIGGGGDAGTAANRNVASGDWSFVGGGGANTASGIASVVVGGGKFGAGYSANTASGTSAFVGAGYGNVASGFTTSVVGGTNNLANNNFGVIVGGAAGTTRALVANFVHPSGNPLNSVAGASQAGLLVLAVQTTDATATVLRSDAAAAGTVNQVILPNNSAYFFLGEVIAGVTGGGNTKGWTIEGVIKRGANAASTALVGTPTVTSSFADAGASTWVIAVTADTTNGGLAVTFTGQAGTTIRTVAQIRTTEMTF